MDPSYYLMFFSKHRKTLNVINMYFNLHNVRKVNRIFIMGKYLLTTFILSQSNEIANEISKGMRYVITAILYI